MDDPRIGKIAKIIGANARVDLIEQAISDFDSKRAEPARAFRYGKPRRKGDKLAAKSLAGALKGVEKVLRRDDVRRLVRKFGGPLPADFAGWAEKLGPYRERLDGFATWSLDAPHGHKDESAAKHVAMRTAVALLQAHGRPVTKTKTCSIAAALFGDSYLDYRHFEFYFYALRK